MEEEIVKATIEDARIEKISNIFKTLHKPKGLTFADTDAVMLKIKVDNKVISETFYCCISANGTVNTSVASKEAKRRQRALASFIKAYISKDPTYNIREGISAWKGKQIKMLRRDKEYLLV